MFLFVWLQFDEIGQKQKELYVVKTISHAVLIIVEFE